MIRFECGCIALSDDESVAGKRLIVRSCDTDGRDDEYSMYFRDMSGKTFEKVSTADRLEIITALSRLVHEGYKFRTIKQLLQGA